MTATKETAREAYKALESIVKGDPALVLGNSKRCPDVELLRDFLWAAERKLPSQASVDRDRLRRKGVKS